MKYFTKIAARKEEDRLISDMGTGAAVGTAAGVGYGAGILSKYKDIFKGYSPKDKLKTKLKYLKKPAAIGAGIGLLAGTGAHIAKEKNK